MRAVIIVKGLVQGVGYRYFAARCARTFGLNGYVLNLPEVDKVKLEVEGEKNLIEDFIKELKKGPTGAYVENLKVEWSDFLNEFREFNIKF